MRAHPVTRPARVAIIGGGCGGMTAAWELSRPEHGGRFEVTVFQEGWRLGGKGASGRGKAGRIEEHGLHIWLGYYDNSFRMMRECYAELEARGLGGEFGDWREAFTPEPDIGLFSSTERLGWQYWRGQFPPRPGLPGDPVDPARDFSMEAYLRGAVDMLLTLLFELEVSRRDADVADFPLDGPATARQADEDDTDAVLSAIRRLLSHGLFVSAVLLAEGLALLRAGLQAVPPAYAHVLLRLAEWVSAGLRRWVEDNLIAGDERRHVWEVMDVVLASVVGALRVGLLSDPRGFDAINDYDCREWLRANGASERAIDSPFVRGLYDLGFAYEGGDPARPAFAAGQALRGALRLFCGYRGAPFWRMRAGMGDVVFAPLFRLLQLRGVRFEFFHRLTNVGLAPGGAPRPGERSHVASLDFDVQARTIDDRDYAPLVEVAGRPCWPATPLFDQLRDGSAMAEAGVDFESHWDRHRLEIRRLTVGADFDFVVLAVGLGAIPHVGSELLARDERWRLMTHNVKTVATQAFQIWLSEDLESLGWRGPPYIASAFVKPFDTWCDMAHVIPEEGWPQRPATCVYFCSTLDEPPTGPDPAAPDYPRLCAERVREHAIGFLGASARHLWPSVSDGSGRFRWDLLVDPDEGGPASSGASGPARFASQYWRANVNPSDRYVLSVPGSARFRISPLDITYDNLTIAGDWTDCGLSTGCTEAAVMSGRLAAHALSGLPHLEDVIGYDHP